MSGSLEHSCLHLSLLGPPQMYHKGQLLAFPSRKALALLIYLAVEGKAYSRKTLSEMFWPESDAAHARTTLRVIVRELREVLDEGTSLMDNGSFDHVPHLLIDRNVLGLDMRSGVSLDLYTLQAAWSLAQGTSCKATTLPEEVYRVQQAQLHRAISLVHGEFLTDFSLQNTHHFDDWVRFQREYWHLRMHLVFDRHSQWYEESGKIEEAIAITSRWLALSSLNEEASLRLMRLHFVSGNRIAALQVYESLRTVLASELHAEPTPQTMALAERIRASVPPHQQKQWSHPASSPLQTLLNAPLIGRDKEYNSLLERYHAAHSGKVQVVLLEGEAGSGKTRLATEFVDWAAAQGADVLCGQAFESGGRLSYQPVIEALRPRIDQENAPDDLLHDVWLSELARLLPELRERYHDLPNPAADTSLARNHLFEAIVRLLEALAAHAPLILFLDDLHWADTDSLDLLCYLARSFAERAMPVLLLFSLCTKALQSAPHLAQWRANLRRIVSLTQLELDPLTAQDIVLLLRALTGGDLVEKATGLDTLDFSRQLSANFLERLAQRLFTETGGQPFYLIEMLKLLLERSHFTPRPGKNDARANDFAATIIKELGEVRLFPPSVRELLSLQLDRLSPAGFAFLVAGAVLEQEATFERLCLVADLSEKEGLTALDEVLRSRLVHESKQKSGQAYAFHHDMIRQVVYVEAGETRCRIFHRRAFLVLQEASVSSAKLAYHALAAEMLEPAFHLSVVAGDEALAVFALYDAIEHYEQAWRLLAKQADKHTMPGKLTASDLEHLYASLGRACKLMRRWESAHPTYGAMLEHVLRITDRYDGTPELAKTEWYLAMIDMYTSEPAVAVTYGEHALALARDLEQPILIVQSLDALTYIMMQMGAWEENGKLAAEAHSLYASMSDRAMEAHCLCQLAHVCLHRGQPQTAIRQARSALIISQDIKNAWGQISAMYELTAGLLDIGAYTEALDIAQQAVESARELEAPSSTANLMLLCSIIQLGDTYRALQAFDTARKIDLEALKLNEAVVSGPSTTLVSAALCADCVLSEKWTDAYHYARQALAVEDYNVFSYTRIPHWCVIEVLLRARDAGLARECISRLGKRSGDGRRDQIEYLRAYGVLAQWEGHLEQAVTVLEQVRALAEEIGLPGELWQIQADLGDLYQARGEQGLADQAYVQAVLVIQQLARNIGDEALRSSFLSAPLMWRILEQEGHGISLRHGSKHLLHPVEIPRS